MPPFNDFLAGCEVFQGFQAFCKVAGIQEVLQILFELVMWLILIAFDEAVKRKTMTYFGIRQRLQGRLAAILDTE